MTLRAGVAIRAGLALGAAALSGCASRGFLCPARGGEPWREIASENYLVHTDLDSADASAMTVQLEQLRATLLAAMRFKPPEGRQARIEVVVFARRAEMAEVVPTGHIGVFQRDFYGRRFILIDGTVGLQRRELLAHELAHYLAAYAIKRQPRWFAEGLAMLLETVGAASPGAPARIGLPPGRWTGKLRTTLEPAEQLLRWRGMQESAEEGGKYRSSWALVHYLFEDRADQFEQLQRRFSRGEESESAWNAVFPEWSLEVPGATQKLDAELRDYLRRGKVAYVEVQGHASPHLEERPLTAAEVHTLRLRLPRKWARGALQAEEDEALAEDPSHVAALTSRAARDRWQATGWARKATAGHPDDPRAWLLLGMALGEEDQVAERTAALERALQLEPTLLDARLALAAQRLEQEQPERALLRQPLARAGRRPHQSCWRRALDWRGNARSGRGPLPALPWCAKSWSPSPRAARSPTCARPTASARRPWSR